MHVSNLPTIEELGRDVIRLPRWRVIISLIAPFGLFCLYVGTWIVPLITAYIPHNPKGGSTLSQTRRFRGWMVRLIAFDHLYHLEHHLYPAVPHHRWAELARRLDPYLDRAGVPSVRLGF